MSVARIAEVLQRDFRTAANQLRQTGRRLRTTSRHYLERRGHLDQWAATVNDIRPDLLITYHELMAETADRERHAELLRQIAFKGTAKTASEYVRAHQRPHRRRLRKACQVTIFRVDHFRSDHFGIGNDQPPAMTPAPSSNPTANAPPRTFAHVDTWVFDLDNTLYPHHLNLWQQVDERIRDYIAKFLDTTHDNAFRKQKISTGATAPPCGHDDRARDESRRFLDFVHQIDHSPIAPNPALGRRAGTAAGPQAHSHQRHPRSCRRRHEAARR